MKMVIDIRSNSGRGSFRSLLPWVQIAQRHGWEIIGIADSRQGPTEFSNHGVRVLHVPYRNLLKSRISVLRSLWDYWRLLQKVKPDLIFVNKKREVPRVKALADLCGVPGLYVQPGGQVSEAIANILKSEIYIVYSDENLEQLENLGFPMENAVLMRNRFSESAVPPLDTTIYDVPVTPVQLQFVGRINKAKINSCLLAIDLAERLHTDLGVIKLRIIGPCSEAVNATLMRRIDQANFHAGTAFIEYLGYRDGVFSYVDSAHICFGKGRSVLEPMFRGRVSVVVNEERSFALASSKNLPLLMHRNFSGRRLIPGDTYESLREVVERICAGTIASDYLVEVSEFVREHYLTEDAESRISALFMRGVAHGTARIEAQSIRERSKTIIRAFRLFRQSRKVMSAPDVTDMDVSE